MNIEDVQKELELLEKLKDTLEEIVKLKEKLEQEDRPIYIPYIPPNVWTWPPNYPTIPYGYGDSTSTTDRYHFVTLQ